MPDLTIAIPIGPGHEELAERAMDSVRKQTTPVTGLAFHDGDGQGTGYARNQLLAKVRTRYVAFLDADDWLEPTFAARMMTALKQVEGENVYVYCDWYESTPRGELAHAAPDRCYCFDNGWQVHLVTAVIPAQWAHDVHGFDEGLPGMEDTDFFHKLHEAGHCGRRVEGCLLHYTENGKRSLSFRTHPDYLAIKERVGKRYHKEAMSCCGGDAVQNSGPFGEKQAGDVLVRVNGAAFIRYVGRRSGRIYPEGVGHGALMWVDPADIEGDPARFQRVARVPTLAPEATPAPTVLRTNAEVAEFANAHRHEAHVPQNAQTVQKRLSPVEMMKLAGFRNE